MRCGGRFGKTTKELILIPGAGHFAFMTASAQFMGALIDKVRAVAIAWGA